MTARTHLPLDAGPVIVGAGLAGLVAALELAPLPCTVVTTGEVGTLAASARAQGGLAAALGPGDSPEQHAADTLAAGAGLCDPVVVRRVTDAAEGVVDLLAGLGARFDRTPEGAYRLGLEGAHGRSRIVHAGGDGSGAEILRAVAEAVRHTLSITVLPHTTARDVVVHDGAVVGLVVEDAGATRRIATDRVVLATGGAGGLWQHTTNPTGALGGGLVLAARAGALLRNLEMVQFHPTALDVGTDPMPLLSEAVRGAGAVLVDAGGAPLLPDSLAARDVVARAVYARTQRGQGVFLDARGELALRLVEQFPAFGGACHAGGIDPVTDLVPVRAAAHYHCGGVAVDERGRSTVPGLWACGEVASTGLHGANRLASNSLLEAVVLGRAVAADLREGERSPGAPPRPRSSPPPDGPHPAASRWTPATGQGDLTAIRTLMERAVGVVRDGPDLGAASERLRDIAARTPAGRVHDAAVAALMISASALARTESRGGHARADYPDTDPTARHTDIRLTDVLGPVGPDIARSA